MALDVLQNLFYADKRYKLLVILQGTDTSGKDGTLRGVFSIDDLAVRKQWKQYQAAYEDLLNATSTSWAPWTVVPANSKTHRNLMIATVVCSALQQLDLRFPPSDPALAGLKIMP